jgi:pimeloyl-ACP methyl ester carboxylesterase
MTATSRLEIIRRKPTGKARTTPLLFVHGAYAGAWLWDKHYLPYFAKRGWDAVAFSLSGHGESEGRERLNGFSIRNYVQDLRELVASLPAPPVIIGHSMGGLVVQKFLEEAEVPGVVLMCSVPPHGLLGSTMSLLWSRPSVLFDLARIIGGSDPQLDSIQEALFHQPVDRAVLHECFMFMQPESMRALWDMNGFDLPLPARMRRPPMLILGAGGDIIIPPALVEATGRALHCPVEIIPNVGHALMLESDWKAAPARIAEWLEQQGF